MNNMPEGIIAIFAFRENLSFPVLVYATNEEEKARIAYLNRRFENENITTYQICEWCNHQRIHYEVIYPKRKLLMVFKDPRKLLCYLKVRNIKKFE